MNSPKEALELVLGKSVSDIRSIKSGGLTATQKEDLEKKSDPGFVASKSRNPFSLQSRMRRAAEQSAFEGRLEIFKDQIQAVRKSNELLNRAAIAQVAVAAETFLTGLVADAEKIKHSVKQDAVDGITDRLEQKLMDLKVPRETRSFAAGHDRGLVGTRSQRLRHRRRQDHRSGRGLPEG